MNFEEWWKTVPFYFAERQAAESAWYAREAEVLEASHAATVAALREAANAAQKFWESQCECPTQSCIHTLHKSAYAKVILDLITPGDTNALDERIRRERYAAAVEIHNALSDDCCTEEVICIVGQFEDKFRAALRSPKRSTEKGFAVLRSPAAKEEK